MAKTLTGGSYDEEVFVTKLIVMIVSAISHGMMWWLRERPTSDAALALAIIFAIASSIATIVYTYSAIRKGSANFDSCIMKAGFSMWSLLFPIGQLAVT